MLGVEGPLEDCCQQHLKENWRGTGCAVDSPGGASHPGFPDMNSAVITGGAQVLTIAEHRSLVEPWSLP